MLAAVELGVLVGEFAEKDGIPARGVKRALDFIVITFFDIEQVKILAKHGGLHQLGDGARASCFIEKEDGIGATLDHLLFLEDDLFSGKFVGGEEIRAHVGYFRG